MEAAVRGMIVLNAMNNHGRGCAHLHPVFAFRKAPEASIDSLIWEIDH